MRRQYLQPQYIGAEKQLERAVARGWRQKRFATLFQHIPRPVADATTEAALAADAAASTADRLAAALANRAENNRREEVKDLPYDIQNELDNDPRPAQVDFACFGFRQHPEEYTDDHFKKLYGLLYQRTVDFAEKWFGDVDLPDPGYQGSPWQESFNDQFIEYTRLVAHEDRHVGGWPAFLRQAKYRKWLIVGILGQIMEKKIYTELLFGASEAWKSELEMDDIKLIDIEGKHKI